MDEIKNLHEESTFINGARQMLLTLLDNYKIVAKEKHDKDDAVYAKAEIEMILDSKDNTRKFLYEGFLGGVSYYGHQRDKKGRLVSCEATFEK